MAAVSPVAANPAAVGKDLAVKLSGFAQVNLAVANQDVSAGFGRGYWVKVDGAAIQFDASATADNGLHYGLRLDVLAYADANTNADEVFAFLNTAWGRVELGDQDDAGVRMHVEADNVMVGRRGFSGDAPEIFQFGSGGALSTPILTQTGDAKKIIYFTPRVEGLQLGASFTPDSGANGASFAERDNDGDFENVVSLAANYTTKLDGVTLLVSVAGEFGDDEAANGAETPGDLETLAVGGTAKFQGFSIGAGYVDLANRGLTQADIDGGADGGAHWSAAASYRKGPWGVSLGYFSSAKSQTTGRGGDTRVDVLSLDGSYNVAPGWSTALSVNFVEATNINGTATQVDNDGSVVILSNLFRF
ncbi:MAG: porin [Alphaproteobacteria bacterium]|nr:porin [Alphaproteobacteria bacterium]